MTKYNQGWSQVNKPQEQKFELIPLLLVVIAVEMIVIIQLINNCGRLL